MREPVVEEPKRRSVWSSGIGLVVVIVLALLVVWFIYSNTAPIDLAVLPGAPQVHVAPSLLVIISLVLGAVIWTLIRRGSRKSRGEG